MQSPLGEMREPVVVRVPVLTVDESGGEVMGYGESDPIFVSIRAMSTRETLAFGQINADVTHVCWGHYHDLNAISADSRIKMLETGQEFDIAGSPINSPTRDWTRLNLVWRENA